MERAARLPVTRRCLLTAAADIEIEDHGENYHNRDDLECERWHRAPKYTRGLAAATADTGQGRRLGLECGRLMRLDRGRGRGRPHGSAGSEVTNGIPGQTVRPQGR